LEETKKFPFRRLIIVVCIFLLLTVFAVASYVSLQMGLFTVERIHITGNNRITKREILKRSGLRPGKSNIFFFEDQVEEGIKKNPWIKRVSVNKEFPKNVYIEVEEEEVYCIVLSESGRPLYMSSSGNKLGSGNFDMGLDFPVLIGDGIDNPELLREALDILELSKSSSVLKWEDISEVHIDTIYGIDIFTNDNRRIEFNKGNIAEKWDKLEKILRHSGSLGLKESYINVAADNIGVVRFKKQPLSTGAGDG